LLKPSTTMQQPSPPQPPPKDRTLVCCKLRVQRFLLSILHWWPLFRASCTFCDKLPESISVDLAQKIVHCCCGDTRGEGSSNNGNDLEDLLKNATIVIDSLAREDQNAAS